jgi:DNA-binding GntR family transcriptional regulator
LRGRYPQLKNIYRVRAALSPLIHEGLLESVQGSGSFVRRLPESVDDRRSDIQLLDDVLADLDALRTKMLSLRERLADADRR